MARLKFSAGFDGVLGAVGDWKGLLAIKAPTNQMVAVTRVKVSGAGTSGDAKPIDVRLARITAGSGSGTTVTPKPLNNGLSCSIQSTARKDFDGNETYDGTDPFIYPASFHPQTGFVDEFPFEDVIIKEGTELLLEVKIASAQTQIAFDGHLICEE